MSSQVLKDSYVRLLNLDLPKGAEWMIKGAHTPSLRVQTAPFGRCWNSFNLIISYVTQAKNYDIKEVLNGVFTFFFITPLQNSHPCFVAVSNIYLHQTETFPQKNRRVSFQLPLPPNFHSSPSPTTANHRGTIHPPTWWRNHQSPPPTQASEQRRTPAFPRWKFRKGRSRTLPETNGLHLKINGWKMKTFWEGPFLGAMLVSGGVILFKMSEGCFFFLGGSLFLFLGWWLLWIFGSNIGSFLVSGGWGNIRIVFFFRTSVLNYWVTWWLGIRLGSKYFPIESEHKDTSSSSPICVVSWKL